MIKRCKLAFWIVTAWLWATPSLTAFPYEGVTISRLQQHRGIEEGEIHFKRPVSSLCEVFLQAEGVQIPLHVGSDFVIAGAMFRNQIPITSRKLTEVALPVDKGTLAALEAAVAFIYRPVKASPGRVLYMFTDPLCPYCNEAAKQVRDLADRRGVTVKAVLYTVHGDQRTGVGRGYEKAMEAICRGFDFEQYLALAWKEGSLSQTFRCPRGRILLRLAADAAETLGIDSVPTFILDDGTRITGADMQALDAALDEAS